MILSVVAAMSHSHHRRMEGGNAGVLAGGGGGNDCRALAQATNVNAKVHVDLVLDGTGDDDVALASWTKGIWNLMQTWKK